MYDAIVIGARCAGSPTAMLLARKGYRVLLADRDTFPSDVMSTHFIWQSGVSRLQQWGILDRVRASGCPPILKITLDFGAFELCGCPPAAGSGATREAFAPRRHVLDTILLDAAFEAGAEVRQAVSVQELLFTDGRVAGIAAKTKDGSFVEKAQIVVGADGVNSTVARAAGAPRTVDRGAAGCLYYSYWSSVPTDGSELHFRGNRTVIAFPTTDGLTCIVVTAPASDFAQYRARIEATYLGAIDLVPPLAERVRAGRRVERFRGARFENFFRRSHGPGWALVGDAGYHKDPYTAQGISDAFRDAELLAAAIDDGLSGRCNIDSALEEYEMTRDRLSMPAFDSTVARAGLSPPAPETLALLAALRGNQEQIDRLLGTDAGTVAHSDFFSHENVGRILARTARA